MIRDGEWLMVDFCDRDFKDPITGATYRLTISQPIQASSGEWSSTVSILRSGYTETEEAFGFDAHQTLYSASDVARSLLLRTAPQAVWHDMPIDIAFPRALPIFLGIQFYREANSQLDELIEAFNKRFE